ncbi:polysaccharide deacetylase family protein [Priestia megaterium]|uniref:polysaccharide deacetylase family protein n=1 Tax=Priestia megaterium TaxID=1404 RepID=UPI002E1F7A40|nr:polysaccharide deacetylase family protein [Priestia megaterium]MED4275759.1 polysaccharide deacetylase family protein [Priestia megaterium]MED4314929.1 polysaccharide deacetylase family protein [Priestia megaterium]
MNQNSPKYVALTFDDGPSAYTAAILKILKRYNVRATFFVAGAEAEKFPKLIRRIHRAKHVIGNHTWSHPDITTLSKRELWKEINSTNAQIEKIIGYSPKLFRPPYSSINDPALTAIKELGMTSVLWNVDSQDWREEDPLAIYKHTIKNLQEKNLIVMHDGDRYGSGARDQIVTSLPKLIKYLIKNDYQFVTVPEFHRVAYKIEGWS